MAAIVITIVAIIIIAIVVTIVTVTASTFGVMILMNSQMQSLNQPQNVQKNNCEGGVIQPPLD